jgi:hypothetical protein
VDEGRSRPPQQVQFRGTRPEGLKACDMKIGVEVQHNEHVSPIVSTVLIVAGAGMMIAGGQRKTG